jgi:hypothetical protein
MVTNEIKEVKILHRLNDGFKIKVKNIKFLEYDKNNTGLTLHDKPDIGYSCLCNLDSNDNHLWQTSPIIKILSDTEFKTLNSHYEIKNYEKETTSK